MSRKGILCSSLINTLDTKNTFEGALCTPSNVFLLSCIIVLMNHGLLCIIQTIPVGTAATAAANAPVPCLSEHLMTSVIAAVLLISEDVVHTLKGLEDSCIYEYTAIKVKN